MDREYDLFEQFPDGSTRWHTNATGVENARAKLEALARNTPNECFAIHLPTKEILARLNVRADARESGKRLIVQIAYENSSAAERTQILVMCGYEVMSLIGNEAAKAVLGKPHRCDLFIISHGAPEKTRKEIAAWLKEKYPSVRILALNSPGIRELAGADYNVKANGPETWLPFVTRAFAAAG